MTTKTLVLGFKEYNHFNFYEKKKFLKNQKKISSLKRDDNNGYWIDINIDYIALIKDARTHILTLF